MKPYQHNPSIYLIIQLCTQNIYTQCQYINNITQYKVLCQYFQFSLPQSYTNNSNKSTMEDIITQNYEFVITPLEILNKNQYHSSATTTTTAVNGNVVISKDQHGSRSHSQPHQSHPNSHTNSNNINTNTHTNKSIVIKLGNSTGKCNKLKTSISLTTQVLFSKINNKYCPLKGIIKIYDVIDQQNNQIISCIGTFQVEDLLDQRISKQTIVKNIGATVLKMEIVVKKLRNDQDSDHDHEKSMENQMAIEKSLQIMKISREMKLSKQMKLSKEMKLSKQMKFSKAHSTQKQKSSIDLFGLDQSISVADSQNLRQNSENSHHIPASAHHQDQLDQQQLLKQGAGIRRVNTLNIGINYCKNDLIDLKSGINFGLSNKSVSHRTPHNKLQAKVISLKKGKSSQQPISSLMANFSQINNASHVSQNLVNNHNNYEYSCMMVNGTSIMPNKVQQKLLLNQDHNNNNNSNAKNIKNPNPNTDHNNYTLQLQSNQSNQFQKSAQLPNHIGLIFPLIPQIITKSQNRTKDIKNNNTINNNNDNNYLNCNFNKIQGQSIQSINLSSDSILNSKQVTRSIQFERNSFDPNTNTNTNTNVNKNTNTNTHTNTNTNKNDTKFNVSTTTQQNNNYYHASNYQQHQQQQNNEYQPTQSQHVDNNLSNSNASVTTSIISHPQLYQEYQKNQLETLGELLIQQRRKNLIYQQKNQKINLKIITLKHKYITLVEQWQKWCQSGIKFIQNIRKDKNGNYILQIFQQQNMLALKYNTSQHPENIFLNFLTQTIDNCQNYSQDTFQRSHIKSQYPSQISGPSSNKKRMSTQPQSLSNSFSPNVQIDKILQKIEVTYSNNNKLLSLTKEQENKIKNLVENLGKNQQILETIKNQNHKLLEQIGDFQRQIQYLKLQNNSLTGINSYLKQKDAQMQSIITLKQTTIQNMKKIMQQNNEQMDKLQEQISNYKKINQNKQLMLEQMRQQLADKQEIIQNYKQIYGDLKRQYKSRDTLHSCVSMCVKSVVENYLGEDRDDDREDLRQTKSQLI